MKVEGQVLGENSSNNQIPAKMTAVQADSAKKEADKKKWMKRI
jgi:hypothetical protein